MGKVRPNLDVFQAEQGGKTLSVFAQELGINAGTLSRVLTGKALPGNAFIAGAVMNLPHKFDDLFVAED